MMLYFVIVLILRMRRFYDEYNTKVSFLGTVSPEDYYLIACSM